MLPGTHAECHFQAFRWDERGCKMGSMMLMQKSSPKFDFQKLRERGVVSIMVSIVLMAVMTLIVLGFSEIARRDQRQTLDRQLSNQAFYAAEIGVNDAQQAI